MLTRTGRLNHRPVSRIFASSGDETRVVRAADWALLVISVVALLMSSWASADGTATERWLTSIFASPPSWVTWLAHVVFAVGGLVVVGLIVLLLVRRDRSALLRDLLIASALTVVVGLVLGRWVSGEWPDLVPEITNDDGVPPFPNMRLAMVVAAMFAVRPSLTAPVRKLDHWLIGAMVIASMVLGFGTLTSVVGAISLGIAAACVTRVWFGTSIAIPTLDRVRASLSVLHVAANDLEYVVGARHGRLDARATDELGPIDIAIYGRDAADSAFASRLWRAMWYRDGRSLLNVSRQQQAGHEALVLLLARRAGLVVPEVVTVGATWTGDVLLVTRDEGRSTLADLDPTALTDDVLDALWQQLRRLHDADLSHGCLNPASITLSDADHSALPGFREMGNSKVSPQDSATDVDIVELLVTTTMLIGIDRAVAAAVRGCAHDDLVRALTAIQPAALSRELAVEVRARSMKLADLRQRTATALEVEEPKPVNLRRVRWQDVIMWVLMLVVVNAIVSWLISIDLSTFLDDLANASVGWLLLALVLSQLTNVAETISMMGVVTHPIPFAPTMQFQYATSYIGLAVPSDAGRIAMTIRYLQKLGVPTHVAVGQGPFTTVFGYLIDALLLLISARVIGTSLDVPDDVDLSKFVTLVVIVVALAVIGVAAVMIVPKWRRRIVPAVKEIVGELKGALTDPKRATRMLGGIFAKKLLFALALASILIAYDQPLSFATVIFVNTAVSWFAGIVPVPGGIGVAEAGFVVGLTAFGVPESTALAVALTHRLMTTYIPPVLGFFMMKKLERAGYL